MGFPTSELAADPRVARGMEAQLARRREALDAGDGSLGWKLGFGSPAAMEKLDISAPLVGSLRTSGLYDAGEGVRVGQWMNPALEPEVAVHITRDLPAGAGPEEVKRAIGGIGPAFELADVEPPPTDVQAILEGNIFQRGCVLGPVAQRDSLTGVAGRVVVNEEEPLLADDPQALTGEMPGLVRHVAELLDAFGERLRAGEVVITGSIVPPLSVAPGDRVLYELKPVGALSIRIEA